MVKQNKNTILIIAAHPDDEVLGCGGTIAKYVNRGNKAYCLFLGRGKASRIINREIKKIKKEQCILEREARKAAEILGISEIFFEDFPDQKYDTVPFLDIVKAIERIKNKIKPEIIFTHHSGDLNLDHQITFKAVLTACRPTENEDIKEIYSFEVPSSTEWSFQKINGPFSPNVFEDISKTINKKIKTLKIYKTEIRDFPHPRSKEAILATARKWGSVAGVGSAEAFELIRILR